MVNGSTIAQYHQNWLLTWTFPLASCWKKGMAKRDAIEVPGKKTMVTAARLLIAEESLLLASAIALDSLASSMLAWVSCCAVRWKSCGRQSASDVLELHN